MVSLTLQTSVSEDVDRYFTKNGVKVPIMKINRIMGTVLSKNKNKGSIALLTEDGVVDVKFRLEHFAMFDKQVSEIQDNGEKKNYRQILVWKKVAKLLLLDIDVEMVCM